MSLTARRIIVVAGLFALILSFIAASKLAQKKEEPKPQTTANPVRQVDTLHARLTTVPTTLEVQGELAAFDKIDLFSEVTGTLKATSRPFKVGAYFPKGAVMIQVEQEEARLSLLSQKANLLNAVTQLMPDLKVDYPESFSQWQAYLDSFDLTGAIRPFPEPLNDQEKYFIASRNLYSQYYTIKSTEERLDKYTLYAPFSGVLTAASINPGAVVRAGQKLGELMSTGSYELVVTVPLRDLKYIATGSPVTLYSDDISGQWQGRVSRISDQVEAGTQTVKVFISANGKGLRENMYLRGEIKASKIENAFVLPRQLLTDQSSVYTVQDSFLRLKAVDVVKMTDNDAIVRGLSNGTALLATPQPDAFDGMKVAPKARGAKTAAKGLN